MVTTMNELVISGMRTAFKWHYDSLSYSQEMDFM